MYKSMEFKSNILMDQGQKLIFENIREYFFTKISIMNYWLVKSEPSTYSWDDFTELGRDHWDGVRNYQARNNLMAMKALDRVLFYHSVKGKEVVGIAEVVREHYPDPTTDDKRWVVVDLEPVEKLPKPVTLEQIKADERLTEIALIKQSRLSVLPLKKEEYDIILGLAYD